MAENLSNDVTFMAFAYARSDDPDGLMGRWLLVQKIQLYMFIVARRSMMVVLLV
jgi:hypothetical protein